mmetsp:Transcript_54808/g.128196  ORF Transcript_54808/g.128196 Transcript_54808/m.128196 type:complete len:93 (+) Transcript_54808:329-607(+)
MLPGPRCTMSTGIGTLVQVLEGVAMRSPMLKSLDTVIFMTVIHTPHKWSVALTKMASTRICISIPSGEAARQLGALGLERAETNQDLCGELM